MTATIYTSRLPPIEIVERNVYTHVLPKDDLFSDDSPAFIDADTSLTLTRGALRQATLELAWGLRHVLHANFEGPALVRGDTILVFSPNSVAYPIIVHGAFAGGLRATLANSAYMPPELAHQFSDSGAKVVFAHPTLVPVVLRMFELLNVDAMEARSRIIIAGWGLIDKGPNGFVRMEDLLGRGQMEAEEFGGRLSEETTLLCYSSGTTGKPKGVETTHKNLTSNMSMVKTVFPSQHGKDVTLGVLPFFHIYGKCFKPASALYPRRYIDKYKVTYAFIVPPIMVVLSRHPAISQFNIKSLQRLVSGAAPLGASLTKAVVDRLKSLGAQTTIVQGYGLTETSPTSHMIPQVDSERKLGSVGVLFPNLEARLITDDGHDAREGESGELWMRGPTIMKGYLGNPEATRSSITPEGWFKTGDVAIVDKEGFYYIVDRKKELIKYKGFQVPPAELEAVLLQHPDIADAAVIGVESHAEATELPRAYVVHVQGVPASEAERHAFGWSVQKWIEGIVARHKQLRGGVAIVETIPKSASGKILRRELRERARKEVAALEAAASPKAKL